MFRCAFQANVLRTNRRGLLVAVQAHCSPPQACHRGFHAYRTLLQQRYNLADVGTTPFLTASDAALQHTYLNQTDTSADDLVVLPGFLHEAEQKILLTACLLKLDAVEDREQRKRRRDYLRAHKGVAEPAGKIDFLPDAAYAFHEKHFDGVISGYRETTLTSWPESPHYAARDLQQILDKLYGLMPASAQEQHTHASSLVSPPHLLSHILHLSAGGYILPHVDNVEASAGTIAGISLGHERELVLQRSGKNEAFRGGQEFRLRLPPGSAYVQRGLIRYGWAHSIPATTSAVMDGSCQRISVMIRDRLDSS